MRPGLLRVRHDGEQATFALQAIEVGTKSPQTVRLVEPVWRPLEDEER